LKVHLVPYSFEEFVERPAELQPVLDAVPAYIFLAHDPDCLYITGNSITYELLGVPPGSNLSRAALEGEPPKNLRIMRDGRELPLQELPLHQAASGQIVGEAEVDLVLDDGSVRCLWGNAVPLLGKDGRPRGAVAAFRYHRATADQGATFYFALPKHVEESLTNNGEPAKEPPPE
jgi:two-component system CheB/CheR fusion protein